MEQYNPVANFQDNLHCEIICYMSEVSRGQCVNMMRFIISAGISSGPDNFLLFCSNTARPWSCSVISVSSSLSCMS